jgi:single-strand DNA-binding protein
MNKFIGTGNLTKDIELRYTTTSSIPVIQNSIAMRNDFKNANGEYDTTFINFVAYRNNAEFLSKYASKGSKILIEGRINNRSYNKQDGAKAYITEVIAEKVELFNSPAKSGQTTEKPDAAAEVTDPFTEFGNEVIINDDDLPF